MVWRNKQDAQGGVIFFLQPFTDGPLKNASGLFPGSPSFPYQYVGAIELVCVGFLL